MQVENLIIGAGIAGAAMAHRLRGKNVLVVDAGEIAASASGNSKGIIRPFLSRGNNDMRRFYHAAYQECLRVVAELRNDFIVQTGILQLPKPAETRFAQAAELAGLPLEDLEYLTAAAASACLGTECLTDGIYWRRGLVVDPALWARALLGDTSIKTQTRIENLIFENGHWHGRTDHDEIITARRVIIATGGATHLLPSEIATQVWPRAGQISFVPHDALPSLPTALSFGNYWLPPADAADQHLIGATFEITDQAAVTNKGHQYNIIAIQNLAEFLPDIYSAAQKLRPEMCTGRAAVRATARDHMPIFGRAENGIYYLTGLGSRGLMSAPYVAALLCKLMD